MSPQLLKERVNDDLLEKLGFVASKKVFKQTLVKANTVKHYKQQKYNLLREESEGFSKLYIELLLFFSSITGPVSCDAMVQRVNSFIGCFQLDPNRSADVMMEAFERVVARKNMNEFSQTAFVTLLKLFNSTSVTHILGFKFEAYSKPDSPDYTPRSLFQLAALLLKAKIVNIVELYPHVSHSSPSPFFRAIVGLVLFSFGGGSSLVFQLSPDDKDLVKDREEFIKEAVNTLKRATEIRVNATDEKEEQEKEEEEKKKRRAELSAKADSKIAAAGGIHGPEFGPPQQKIELLACVLDSDDWPTAEWLLTRLKAIVPVSNSRVCQALCSYIHRHVEPVYGPIAAKFRVLSSAKPLGATLPIEDAPAILCVPVSFLNIYLHKDPMLFSKICRVIAASLRKTAEGQSGGNNQNTVQPMIVDEKEDRAGDEDGAEDGDDNEGGQLLSTCVTEVKITQDVEDLLADTLLPTFALFPSNCGLASELWSVLSLLSYKMRYTLYGEWDRVSYDKYAELMVAKAEVLKQTRYMSRRIVAGGEKEAGRKLIKYSSSHPLVVFDIVLNQVQTLEGFGALIVDSTKYLTKLNHDVLTFMTIRRMSESQMKELKSDGQNESSFLRRLSAFVGMFFRKYIDVDLDSVLEFIVAQLQDDQPIYLILLKDLISNMSGLKASDDLSDDMLLGQAGGDLLQDETFTFRQNKNYKKSSQALLQSLWRTKVILPLFVLMAQLRSYVSLRTSEFNQLGVITGYVDKIQEAFTLFTDFVTSRIPSPESYASLFPTLFELVTKNFVPLDSAFFMLRTVLLQPSIARAPADLPPLPPLAVGPVVSVSASGDGKETGTDAQVNSVPLPLVETCRRLVPESAWSGLSPELYSLFWSLRMYDLYVPSEIYEVMMLCRKADVRF